MYTMLKFEVHIRHTPLGFYFGVAAAVVVGVTVIVGCVITAAADAEEFAAPGPAATALFLLWLETARACFA